MSNRAIMNGEIDCLRWDASIGEALDSLYCHHYYSLPVVDAAGRYLGMYGIRQILAQLLPKAVIIEGGLSEVSYIRDTLEHLRERLSSFRDKPIHDAIDRDVPTASDDAPLLETLVHLYRGANNIPIIDPASGALRGIVSSWEVLAALTQNKAN